MHGKFLSFKKLSLRFLFLSFISLSKSTWLSFHVCFPNKAVMTAFTVKWQGLQIPTTTLRCCQPRGSCLPCTVWLAPTHQHLKLKSVPKKNHNSLQDQDPSSQLSISKAVDIKLIRVGQLVKCTQTLLSCPPMWMKYQLRNNILNKDKVDAGDETQETRVHIFGSVRIPGGGHGNPLQCSCLENPTERGAWRLQPMGSQTVRHNGRDWAHETDKEMQEDERIFFQLWTQVWLSRQTIGRYNSPTDRQSIHVPQSTKGTGPGDSVLESVTWIHLWK